MTDSISIIIPTLNEVAVIEHCLTRAWQAGADQVIVSDGDSSDGTFEKLQSLNCQCVTSTPGRGHQLDTGAKTATGDWLLFLHADNWLASECCDQIRQCGDDADVRFGGFRQQIQAAGRSYRWIETGNALRVQWRGLIYGDQAFFIRRSLYQEIGGFPKIPIMEDVAISQQLKRHGKPRLLPGPTFVSARRWQQRGIVKQTLKNWYLSTRFLLGASPEKLASEYHHPA